MKRLYAPWRNNYSLSSERTKSDQVPQAECVFCIKLEKNNDDESFILKRGKEAIIFLNRYPYSAGHLLIIPADHRAHLADLTPSARAEIMELMSASVTLLKAVLNPDGFNTGLNMGIAAGGSVPSHLHMHVVPRWSGDTSFLSTIGDIKVVAFDLPEMYKKLKPAFANEMPVL
jgi:ATP adenylyltransferase